MANSNRSFAGWVGMLTCSVLLVACRGVQAQTWTGGGATAAWTEAGNWSTVPDFSGTSTALITIPNAFASGTAMTLDGDKTIDRLTISGTGFSISGDTLTIRSGSISATGGLTQTIASGVVLGASGTWSTSGQSNQILTVTGVIGDGGNGYSITKMGTRTLALTGANTFSGGFIWNQGTVRIGNDAAFGTGTLALNGGNLTAIPVNSGTYKLANAVTWSGTLNRSSPSGSLWFLGPITLTNDATLNALLQATGESNKTHFGAGAAMTGDFGFRFITGGSRVVVIESQNSYTGGTTIEGTGIVQLTGGDDRLPTTGALTMVSNPRLQLEGGISQTVGSLSGPGRIELTGGAFTAGGDDLSTEFSGTFSGTGGSRFVKVGTGTLTLSGTSTHAGGTIVSGGVLKIENASALGTGTAGVNGGTLDLNGFNVTMNAFSIGGPSGAGQLIGGTISIPGNVAYVSTPGGVVIDDSLSLVNSGTGWSFDVGGTGVGADALTFERTISAGGVTKTNSGRLVLADPANSYTGQTSILDGVLEASVLADAGVASTIGAATGTDARIELGSGATTGTLRYTGTGHSTNREIRLSGSSGGGGLDASGSGPLVLTGSITMAGGAKTLTLTGTNAGLNTIGPIGGTGVSVAKTGVGTWVIDGTNDYTGTLTVEQGTLVAAGSAPEIGSGVFGADSSPRPAIGQVDASGTVSFLVVAGGTIARSFDVVASGSGTQEVILRGSGTGSTTFTSSAGIRLGRDVTLAADEGHDAVFQNPWQTLAGDPGPAVAFNVGTATATGTVTLRSFVPDSITAVNVRRGTLRLDLPGGETLGSVTPLAVGSGLGVATVDLADDAQTLQTLAFGGTAGLIVPGGGSGLLRLSGSTPTVTAATGAGHRIESGIALDVTPTFDVTAAAARLTVDAAIANGTNGIQGLVKSGSGTLALLGANSFSGAIDVAVGTLELGASATVAANTIRVRNAESVFDATAVSGGFLVDQGQVMAGNGTFLGSYVVAGGGVIAPGNSVGGLTYQTLTFGTAGVFDFEINDATGMSGVDPGWDLATVTDGFTLDATDVDPFVVRIISLSGTAAGLAANFDETQSYQWKFLVAPAEIASFSTMKFSIDASGFQNPAGGAFSVLRGVGLNNNELYVAYTAIPEPGTLALAAIGLAAAAVARRRATQSG